MMNTFFNLRLRVLLSMIISFACTHNFLVAADAHEDHKDHEEHHELDLKIGWVMGTVPLKVRFSLKNEGDEKFITTPIGTNRNRIIILTPGGKTVEHYSWKDGIKEIEIGVGEEKFWDVPIQPIFGLYHLKESGFYEISWSLEGIKSPKMFIFTNNK